MYINSNDINWDTNRILPKIEYLLLLLNAVKTRNINDIELINSINSNDNEISIIMNG